METMMATPQDAGIILKLYELRTEPVMRRARAWMLTEFWPATVDEFFAVANDFGSEQNAWFRQVISYWEMAAALVLHGSVSVDLFVDANGEGFFYLAKFAPLLEAIRQRNPVFLIKSSELLSRFTVAAQRYEAIAGRVEMLRARHAEQRVSC